MVNDVTLRVILLMLLINKWDSPNIDVETVFLKSVIEEKIYMKTPEGMSQLLEEHYTSKYKLMLIKSI